jgi:hypothetical protein
MRRTNIPKSILSGFIIAGFALVMLSHSESVFAGEFSWEKLLNLSSQEYQPVMSMDLGQLSLFTLRSLSGLLGVADELPKSFAGLDGVTIKIYQKNVESEKREAEARMSLPATLKNQGWEMFMKVRDREEFVYFLYKPSPNRSQAVESVVMIANTPEELVILEMKGNLRQFLANTIKDSCRNSNKSESAEEGKQQ